MAFQTPVWELPHGKGQGPRPGNHTLPPLKKASASEPEKIWRQGKGGSASA